MLIGTRLISWLWRVAVTTTSPTRAPSATAAAFGPVGLFPLPCVEARGEPGGGAVAAVGAGAGGGAPSWARAGVAARGPASKGTPKSHARRAPAAMPTPPPASQTVGHTVIAVWRTVTLRGSRHLAKHPVDRLGDAREVVLLRDQGRR